MNKALLATIISTVMLCGAANAIDSSSRLLLSDESVDLAKMQEEANGYWPNALNMQGGRG